MSKTRIQRCNKVRWLAFVGLSLVFFFLILKYFSLDMGMKEEVKPNFRTPPR
jgi:hypothetical protein